MLFEGGRNTKIHSRADRWWYTPPESEREQLSFGVVKKMEPILFYRPKEIPYGCFSNFSRHSLTFGSRVWKFSEAPFQAWKFFPHRMDLVDEIHRAKSPMDAATLGRDTTKPLREDWDRPFTPTRQLALPIVNDGRGQANVIDYFKDWVMFCVVHSKFSQNPDIKALLMGSGEQPIIENTDFDPYWGWGCSKTGVNRLGKILMAVRAQLRLDNVSSFESTGSP